MIRLVAAPICPIARRLAPYLRTVFTTNNDCLTQDWGPIYATRPDFGGTFDVITSAPDEGEGDADQ